MRRLITAIANEATPNSISTPVPVVRTRWLFRYDSMAANLRDFFELYEQPNGRHHPLTRVKAQSPAH